jgi:hypothetical protein
MLEYLDGLGIRIRLEAYGVDSGAPSAVPQWSAASFC